MALKEQLEQMGAAMRDSNEQTIELMSQLSMAKRKLRKPHSIWAITIIVDDTAELVSLNAGNESPAKLLRALRIAEDLIVSNLSGGLGR